MKATNYGAYLELNSLDLSAYLGSGGKEGHRRSIDIAGQILNLVDRILFAKGSRDCHC